MPIQVILFLLCSGAVLLLAAALVSRANGSLNGIKAKTVGDGQHGTARWATPKELRRTYWHIPFRMDICCEYPTNLAARAKAEKYAKILAKTIINPEGDAGNYGQNAFFTMQPRDCSRRSFFFWQSTYRRRRANRRSGTSSACSSWCRTFWRPVRRPRTRTASRS